MDVDLIRNNRASGRTRDLADAEPLRCRLKRREGQALRCQQFTAEPYWDLSRRCDHRNSPGRGDDDQLLGLECPANGFGATAFRGELSRVVFRDDVRRAGVSQHATQSEPYASGVVALPVVQRSNQHSGALFPKSPIDARSHTRSAPPDSRRRSSAATLVRCGRGSGMPARASMSERSVRLERTVC